MFLIEPLTYKVNKLILKVKSLSQIFHGRQDLYFLKYTAYLIKGGEVYIMTYLL